MKTDDDTPLIDEDDEMLLEELYTQFRINQKNEVQKLNKKKQKNLTTKLTKRGRNTQETNELFWLNKNELEIVREYSKLKPIKITPRACLKCFQIFESEGSHNRLCDSCRKGI